LDRRIVASPPPDTFWLRLARRVVTVPAYLALTVFATLAAPLLLPLCWIVSLRAGMRGALRSAAFVICYLWCESIGITVSVWLWLRHGLPTRRSGVRWRAFLDGNYALQCWWANALKVAAERMFRLHFAVTGYAALDGAPAIMLPRHASIADTVIPMVFYAIPQRLRLRYVLKRELLFDPCLDIVGNRLPNCFVARRGTGEDIAGVAALARDLGPAEGLLIYPEGTRFSAGRRERILTALAQRASAAEQDRMQRWVNLLPPRIGGVRALIDGAPDRDLVFCAHTGFESASHFRTLINGSWIDAAIKIHFWRIKAAEVPTGEAALRAFLFTQWDRMQDTVTTMQAA
jgi:1-acyl-sn-glycerol-3-phosphate acyltransferase